MRWVVRIEPAEDEAEANADSGAIFIERARLEDAAELGLTLAEGKRIMAFLQQRVVTDQLHEHCRSSRRCSACTGLRAIKDYRHRVIDTVFGRVNVAAPRYERCRCGADCHAVSPVSALVPGRVLPGLLELQARLGADVPYRQAATILQTFLPEATSFNHATTRNRLMKVGRAIEAGLRADIKNVTPPEVPAAEMIVGIDGCFAKGISRKRKTSLEIVLGRIDVPTRNGEVFAVVRRLDGLAKARVRAALRRYGRTRDTVVRVLSDGEDGMRTMLGRWLDPTVEHRLDWWHLYRRLEKMRQGLIYLPFIPGDETGDRLRIEAWGLEHIRWTLWNGCSCVYSTDAAITSFRIDLERHRQAAHAARRSVDRIDYMLQQLDEFRSYLYRNAESLVNYNLARLAGERVSTAHVESTVNELVNWRMCKKQQMRWSPMGAQLLLHVRTADLNGCLRNYVGLKSEMPIAANDDRQIAMAG
jgi:hypothetical protein